MLRNPLRTSLVAIAAFGLLLASTATASAQEVRQPVTIAVAKACGVVTLTFVNPNTDVSKTHVFRWNAVDGNTVTSVGARTGIVTVAPTKTVKETISFTEDEFGGVAAVTVAAIAGPDTDIQPRLDIYPVDTDCKPPVVVPPTTTPAPPTTTLPPTTTPKPTTTTPAPPTTNPTTNPPTSNPTTTVVVPPPVQSPTDIHNDVDVTINGGGGSVTGSDNVVPNTSSGVNTGDGSTL